MRHYFLAVFLSIGRTLRTWYLYPPIVLFIILKFYSVIPFYFFLILGTKLYRYIEQGLPESEVSFLMRNLRDNPSAYRLMLYTQTLSIWGGTIMIILTIVLSLQIKVDEHRWTERAQESFVAECMSWGTEAGLNTQQSKEMCDCFLSKLKQEYPEPLMIRGKISRDVFLDLGVECVEELNMTER